MPWLVGIRDLEPSSSLLAELEEVVNSKRQL